MELAVLRVCWTGQGPTVTVASPSPLRRCTRASPAELKKGKQVGRTVAAVLGRPADSGGGPASARGVRDIRMLGIWAGRVSRPTLSPVRFEATQAGWSTPE